MKGVVQARRYVGSLVRVLLGKEGQGSLKAHMVRGTVGSFALKVVNTVLAFGTSLLLARLLGAKEYGVYAYAISWAQLLAIPAVMGLNTLLVREVAKYKTLEDWGFLRGILRWSDRVVLLTSIGIAAVFSLIVWFLRGKFSPEVRTALWIAMGLVPLLSFLLLRQGGLQGLGYVVEAQVPQLFLLPATFFVLTIGGYFAFGLSGAVAVGLRLIAGLVAVIAAVFLLRKNLPEPVTGVPPLYRQREWVRSALPLLFVGAASIINQQISTVMIGSVLGPKETGIFDIARRAAMVVTFAITAVNMPLAPTVASLYARGETERLQRIVTKTARAALLVSLLIGFSLIIFRRWLFLLFGKGFIGGGTVLIILCLGEVTSTGIGSVALLLNMTGHEQDTAKGIGISAGLNIILNMALIPIWGIEGAAAATAISTVAWHILLAVWVYRRIGIHSTALGKIGNWGSS